MRILGIDPGLRITGYAVLEAGAAQGPADLPALVEAGVIRLRSRGVERGGAGGGGGDGEPERGGASSISERLLELERDVSGILERLRPSVVAVESVFAHVKHPATAIVMGHARGVVLLTIRRAGLRLVELRPAEVKKSLTGSGRATKEQMQRSVQSLFGLAALPEPPDVADAIAIALGASRREAAVV